MCLIEDLFVDCEPSDTTLNDFMWFELADMMDLYKEDTEEEED